MTRTSWCVNLGAVLALGGAARADDGPCKPCQPSTAPCRTSAEECPCYPTVTRDNRQLSAQQRIEDRLLSHFNLTFQQTPLRQVIDDLRALSGITIVLDIEALREANVNLDCPVSLKVKDMSLRSALTLLLKPARLAYILKDDALQITTENELRGKLVMVAYPVADLIVPAGSGEGALPPFLCRKFQEMAGKQAPRMTAEDTLIRVITTTIAPNGWADTSGSGTIQYFPLGLSLVVNQTVDVQEQIVALLTSLRREQALEDREVSVATRVVTRTATGDEVLDLPKITFYRGQRVWTGVGKSVAIRTGTIRDCLDNGSADDEAQEGGARKPADQARNGITLKLCVTKAVAGKLKLDATFEKSEISEATPTGLQVCGQTCRTIQQVESGSSVKMVLSRDERGKPRSWVIMTVTELPVEEECEQIFLGVLPPIPH